MGIESELIYSTQMLCKMSISNINNIKWFASMRKAYCSFHFVLLIWKMNYYFLCQKLTCN